MKKHVISVAISLVTLAFATPAGADDRLVSFDGGIGSQPLRAGAAVNTVRGVNPGGIPWVIERLKADARTDGSIKVDGRGLLLAGGDNVATNGGQSVRAVLFCGPAATATRHQTPTLVRLDPDGDFRIDETLAPAVPRDCADPVLLIVSGGGNWFAAGIPRR